MNQRQLIQRSIEYFGTQTKMAEALGGNVRQGHVHQWLHEIKRVMPHTARSINEASNGHTKASDFYSYIKDVDTETESA